LFFANDLIILFEPVEIIIVTFFQKYISPTVSTHTLKGISLFPCIELGPWAKARAVLAKGKEKRRPDWELAVAGPGASDT
jgi:hypothetical protein